MQEHNENSLLPATTDTDFFRMENDLGVVNFQFDRGDPTEASFSDLERVMETSIWFTVLPRYRDEDLSSSSSSL